MSNVPGDLKYTREHEWAKQEGGRVRVGITAYAQEQLGDGVFVELPKGGAKLTAHQAFGVVESVKAVSDLFAPVSGQVAEVNAELAQKPETVNADPYGKGWMLVVTPSDAKQWNELLTAYTPYQPEASQGTLRTIYEYQTMIAELTGMDVANASIYDGGSSLAEAALMAHSVTSRNEIVLAGGVNPLYRQVVETYVDGAGLRLREAPTPEGVLDLDAARRVVGGKTAALVVQSPNFYGCLEDGAAAAELAHAAGALLVVVSDPVNLGVLEAPGRQGADVVVGEGQGLGVPLGFGGPYLGVFAAKQEFVRRLPGRLVGATVDLDGARGFALTLQTREQHIRRAKATSNICTNVALCALMATIYLATLGKAVA